VTAGAAETILVYRLGSLGDTIVALPIFNRIATLYPEHRRLLLTNEPVSGAAPAMLSVIGTRHLAHGALAYPVGTRDPRRLLALAREIRATGARQAIYAMPTRTAAAMWRDVAFLRLAGITEIIGAPIGADLRQTRLDPATGEEEPEAERLTRALEALGPFDLSDPRLWDLHLDADEHAAADSLLQPLSGAPILAINMGGKLAANDWGEPNWIALLAALFARYPGWGLLVVGGPGDAERATRVAATWPGRSINACGRLEPRATAAALARATLYIGHDTGPLHLANAVGTPVVGLYGNAFRPRKWHAYRQPKRILHDMRGVGAITVPQVLAAAAELLDA
jgi:heptosyltransferase III